jgi:hypothetical protein
MASIQFAELRVLAELIGSKKINATGCADIVDDYFSARVFDELHR